MVEKKWLEKMHLLVCIIQRIYKPIALAPIAGPSSPSLHAGEELLHLTVIKAEAWKGLSGVPMTSLPPRIMMKSTLSA